MIDGRAIVECARSYLGVPWHHQGRNRAGMDCAGLVIRVAQDLGLSTFDVTGYGLQPDGYSMRAHLEKQAQRVLSPELGDILLLRFGRLPQHLAILTDHGMIHTYRQAGAVVEHTLDKIWRRRIVDAYAFPGVF